MRCRLLVPIPIAVVVLAVGWAVAPAGAVAPRDGSGLFVADDDWDFADPGAPPPALGGDLERLRPRAFRLQTIWNSVDRAEWMVRAEALIAAARARGAGEILLTLRSNNPVNVGPAGYFPTPAEYRAKVEPLVRRLAPLVDVWGPANEPNVAWRPKEDPAGQAPLDPIALAGYYEALRDAVRRHDPTALVTSPDFLDAGSLAAFAGYVTAYSGATADGGWGDVVALHPYGDVKRAVAPDSPAAFTDALAALIPPDRPIWVTEVGAHHDGDPAAQAARVVWIAGVLADHPRVARVAYYNMRGGGPDWDTGLLDGDFRRRPAWYAWCAASHGDDPAAPDCAAPPPGAGGPGCIAYFVEYLLLDTREWPGVRCI